MDRLTEFYINGEWVSPLSPDTMPVMNPANGDRLGTVAIGNAEDVDRAVAAATAAFESFSLTLALFKSDPLNARAGAEPHATAVKARRHFCCTSTRQPPKTRSPGRYSSFCAPAS